MHGRNLAPLKKKARRVEDTAGKIMSNHPRSQCAGSVSVPIISLFNSGEFAGPSILAAFPAFGFSSLFVSNVAAALFRAPFRERKMGARNVLLIIEINVECREERNNGNEGTTVPFGTRTERTLPLHPARGRLHVRRKKMKIEKGGDENIKYAKPGRSDILP